MEQEINAEVSYPLSPLELEVLLGIAGIEQIYAFRLPSEEEVTDRQLVGTIWGLVKKQYLCETEDSRLVLSASTPIADCLRNMVQSRVILEFRFPDDEADRIVYCGAKSMSVVACSKTEEEYWISQLSQDELTGWLKSLRTWEQVRMCREQDTTWLSEQYHALEAVRPTRMPNPNEMEQIPGLLCFVRRKADGCLTQLTMTEYGGIVILMLKQKDVLIRQILTAEKYNRLMLDLFSDREVQI